MRFLQKTRFYAGVDLGQMADFSSLVVLQFIEGDSHYYCRWAERFPLNTSYPAICDLVESRIGALAEWSPYLVVDATGPGLAVTDLMKQRGLQLTPVSITSGYETSRGEASMHIPKRQLVGSLSVALQTGRLVVCRGMKYAETLRQELLNFQVRFGKAGFERYEARRAATHDDLAIALMLGLWKLRKQEEGGVITGVFEYLRQQEANTR